MVHMDYAIDGSNVLLDFEINGKPSGRAFAALLSHLLGRGDTCRVFFDNAIRRHMSERGAADSWAKLESAIRASGIGMDFAPHADPVIQAYCNRTSAALINATDYLTSWRARGPLPRAVHRARLVNRNSGVSVELRDAKSKLLTHAPLPKFVTLGGATFSAPPEGETTRRVLTRSSALQRRVTTGTLLVFVLDASISMSWDHTFDGRKKSEHLNDIMLECIRRLSVSVIKPGLYLSFIRFSDDVLPLASPAGTEFAHVDDWRRSERFDYLEGMPMARTNIRAALIRAKELVQDALGDSELLGRIAPEWRAVVVLVTDGRHEVTREDGSEEDDSDVAAAAEQIHLGVSHVYDKTDNQHIRLKDSRITLGCVGIGTDLNDELLLNISSQCSENQKRMARTAQIERHLVAERLFIKVDSNSPTYADAVRAFVDVASSSAG